MSVIHRDATVAYSAAQMFQLVDAIEDYPKFLPWCQEAQVLSRNAEEVRARLIIARAGIQKSFTTCNRIQKDKMIEMRLVDGPFSHLEGFWKFTALSKTTSQVSLDLNFEFSNRLIGLTLGNIFQSVADTLVETFCKRADEICAQR